MFFITILKTNYASQLNFTCCLGFLGALLFLVEYSIFITWCKCIINGLLKRYAVIYSHLILYVLPARREQYILCSTFELNGQSCTIKSYFRSNTKLSNKIFQNKMYGHLKESYFLWLGFIEVTFSFYHCQ